GTIDPNTPSASPGYTDLGYYLVGDDNEKFVNSELAFDGKLITSSYIPSTSSSASCSPSGTGRIYIFFLANGLGTYPATNADDARRAAFTTAMPLSPGIAISGNKANIILQDTAGGVQSPKSLDYTPPPVDMIFWKQQ